MYYCIGDAIMESLRQLRKQNKLTQAQMGNIIGISSRAYREKEKLKAPFSQIEMIKIIIYFNLSSADAYNIFYVSCLPKFKKKFYFNVIK